MLPGAGRVVRAVAYRPDTWRGARAAESARLEIVCGATHRGFKSHPLRSVFPSGRSWSGKTGSGAIFAPNGADCSQTPHRCRLPARCVDYPAGINSRSPRTGFGGSTTGDAGYQRSMLRSRQVSLVTLLWLIVGVIVASSHHFFTQLQTLSQVLSAILAVLVWPLVLLHVHVAI
jgi:hypothetical protein